MWTVHWFRIDEVNPEPWAAPSAVRGKNHIRLVKDQKLVTYQKALAQEIERLYPDLTPMAGPSLGLRFWFWRSTMHGRPADATNLQKATEDALQGLLFTNDREVVRIESTVAEQLPVTVPVIIICLYRVSRPLVMALDGIPRALRQPRPTEDRTSADHARRVHFDPREVF